MPGERRTAHRATIPGMRVVFEGVAGERVEADVINVGSGGLFIRTARPLAVGKRLSLEFGRVADVGAWSALGRVVWTREAATDADPGMGVKLIDVDDAVAAAVERLVDARAGTPAATARTDARKAPEATDVPDVHGMPTREVVVPRMVLMMSATDEAPPTEPAPVVASAEREPVQERARTSQRAVANDVAVAPRRPQVDPAPGGEEQAAPDERGAGGRAGRRWLVFLVLIALAAAALYATGAVSWFDRSVATPTTSPPVTTPVAAPVSTVPAVSTAPAAVRSAAVPPSATATPSRAPASSTVAATPSKLPTRPAPPASPAAAPGNPPASDNPY